MRQNLAELDLGAQFRLKYEAGLRLQYERSYERYHRLKWAVTNPRAISVKKKQNYLLIKAFQKTGIAMMANQRERAEG